MGAEVIVQRVKCLALYDQSEFKRTPGLGTQPGVNSEDRQIWPK